MWPSLAHSDRWLFKYFLYDALRVVTDVDFFLGSVLRACGDVLCTETRPDRIHCCGVVPKGPGWIVGI